MEEIKDRGKIALFYFKSENEKAPIYKGLLKLNGKKYTVSVWKQVSYEGKEYFSGIVEIPEPYNEVEEKKAKSASKYVKEKESKKPKSSKLPNFVENEDEDENENNENFPF